MKKTALTFGLFSLALVATSFANQENGKSNKKEIVSPFEIDGTGGQKTGQDRKQDFAIDGTGGQKTGQDRKQDFASTNRLSSNSQFTTPSRKID
jgi:hypothetical protein